MNKGIIYTSYFAKLKEFDPEKYYLVSIARVTPSWANVNISKTLCPPWEIISKHKSGSITDDYYKNAYLSGLPIDTPSVLEEFSNKIHPKILVLFCYENPDKFCHRHLLADFVNNKLGYNLIREFNFSK